jgi:hypothetical protein
MPNREKEKVATLKNKSISNRGNNRIMKRNGNKLIPPLVAMAWQWDLSFATFFLTAIYVTAIRQILIIYFATIFPCYSKPTHSDHFLITDCSATSPCTWPSKGLASLAGSSSTPISNK